MTLDLINPFDGSLVCSLEYDSASDVEDKLQTAHQCQQNWRRVPIEQRKSIIEQGLERFRERSEETAREVTIQMGKPITEARNEMATLFDRANYMLSIAQESLAAEVLPGKEGFHRRIEHEPLGVVLDLAAWNYPLIIPINVVVPALVAGNTVLLKHSARTPLCGIAA
jgi:acyl-CoA reductase-like NAD-dependent aldehyde dehydrogenase